MIARVIVLACVFLVSVVAFLQPSPEAQGQQKIPLKTNSCYVGLKTHVEFAGEPTNRFRIFIEAHYTTAIGSGVSRLHGDVWDHNVPEGDWQSQHNVLVTADAAGTEVLVYEVEPSTEMWDWINEGQEFGVRVRLTDFDNTVERYRDTSVTQWVPPPLFVTNPLRAVFAQAASYNSE